MLSLVLLLAARIHKTIHKSPTSSIHKSNGSGSIGCNQTLLKQGPLLESNLEVGLSPGQQQSAQLHLQQDQQAQQEQQILLGQQTQQQQPQQKHDHHQHGQQEPGITPHQQSEVQGPSDQHSDEPQQKQLAYQQHGQQVPGITPHQQSEVHGPPGQLIRSPVQLSDELQQQGSQPHGERASEQHKQQVLGPQQDHEVGKEVWTTADRSLFTWSKSRLMLSAFAAWSVYLTTPGKCTQHAFDLGVSYYFQIGVYCCIPLTFA